MSGGGGKDGESPASAFGLRGFLIVRFSCLRPRLKGGVRQEGERPFISHGLRERQRLLQALHCPS